MKFMNFFDIGTWWSISSFFWYKHELHIQIWVRYSSYKLCKQLLMKNENKKQNILMFDDIYWNIRPIQFCSLLLLFLLMYSYPVKTRRKQHCKEDYSNLPWTIHSKKYMLSFFNVKYLKKKTLLDAVNNVFMQNFKEGSTGHLSVLMWIKEYNNQNNFTVLEFSGTLLGTNFIWLVWSTILS